MAGYGISLGITRIPAAAPKKRFQLNFLGDLWSEFRWMQTDRDLWRANLGNTLFFFLAALVQMNLLLYADHILKVNPLENSTLNVALAIGIGAGSLLAGKLSHDKVEYGLIPLGAFLLTAMSLILGWPGVPKAWFIAALMFLELVAASSSSRLPPCSSIASPRTQRRRPGRRLVALVDRHYRRVHPPKGTERDPRLVARPDLLALRRRRAAHRYLHHPDPPERARADGGRVVRGRASRPLTRTTRAAHSRGTGARPATRPAQCH